MPLYNPSAPIEATYLTQSANGVLSGEYVLTAGSNITLTPGAGILTIDAAAGGSSLPVADTQTIVTGSADNTKLFRFEADTNIPTGTTIVGTIPASDFTFAGLEVAQTFTALQTVSVGAVKGFDLITTLPIGNNQASTYTNSAVLRSELFSNGTQTWHLNTGSVEVGRIAYDVLTNTPTIAFFNAAGTGRSQMKHVSAGGLILSANTGAGPPADAVFISTDGNLGLGSAPSSAFRLDVNGLESRFFINNAVTNAVTNLIQLVHRSSGTPAAGFGIGLSAYLESSTINDQNAGRLSWEWSTATHASRKARGVLTAYDTAERECIRWEASGSAAMLGVLGAAAIARQAHIADPAGGGTQDAEARTAINSILLALENFGFLATS